MLKLLLIAIAGGLGALARHAIIVWTPKHQGTSEFPFGTLLVNVLGCLALGFVVAFFAATPHLRSEYRVAITVGLLGAFTTFSTYGLDTLELAGGGQLRLAAINVVASNVLGLAGVWAGHRLGVAFFA